jgi:hypothetical protein
MEGVNEAYHMPFELRLRAELDRKALRQALNRILFRHEALRTTFTQMDGEPVQRVAFVHTENLVWLCYSTRVTMLHALFWLAKNQEWRARRNGFTPTESDRTANDSALAACERFRR